jgi:cytidyltransferase-like protein
MALKAFVSGCFDLLHSGHFEFFRRAADFGDLYVALGSDKTVYELKGRLPINNENERLFMIKAISFVKDVFISQGSGILDFEQELSDLKPDFFIVNEDGNIPAKQHLCQDLGIKYIVLKRDPHQGLLARSTTNLRDINTIPYRIDVCGGWLDQPFCSTLYPGPVITVSIEPTVEFNERSGMATSTRRKAMDLWGSRLPVGDPAKLAKILFCYDNPPGTKEVSGSQDSIGIAMPGLNIAHYKGEYWPMRIDSVRNEDIYCFIEDAFYLIPLGPRQNDYHVLENTHITREGCKALSDAADHCWNAILTRNLPDFGRSVREGFEAQIAMFPNMMNDTLLELIDQYKDQAYGWKVSGAGGGGYLILVSGTPIENAIKIIIRREE